MAVAQTSQGVVIATTPQRVDQARRTHQRVIRRGFIIFGIVVAVLLGVGIPLSVSGTTSLVGILVLAAVFALIPVGILWSTRRLERRAERFLAADGATVIVVGQEALTVADVVVPYERITLVYANTEQEHYSSGGARGAGAVERADLTQGATSAGNVAGAKIGTGMRRALYREGAKSGIEVVIGVDHVSSLDVPDGFVNRLASLPKRGEEPGRIDVPFGAYLGIEDLRGFLEAVTAATDGQLFPVGVVNGTLDWAAAQSSAAETREKIRDEFAGIAERARSARV